MTTKKFSRRDFLRLSALTATGAALAGCATPTPKTVEVTREVTREVERVEKATVVVQATVPPESPKNVVIFVGMGTGTSAEQIAVHEQIQADFNAQTELHTIEFLTSPWADSEAKYTTMIAGGMAPDLCCPIGMGGTASQFDTFGDIQPFVDADKFDLAPLGAQAEMLVFEGKGRVGLPLGAYPSIVFFNQDLFDAAGVDYPPFEFGANYADGDPWTYDKMVEIAKTLTVDANGNNANSPAFDPKTSVQFGWNGWDWNEICQYPAKWGGRNTGVSADNRTALVNSEPWVKMLQFHYDTFWTWYIRASGEQVGAFYAVAGDPFGSGMVAMWENHTWMSWAYSGWTQAFNWGIAAVPWVEGFDPLSSMHADGILLVAAGQQKEAAWWVMKHLVQPEWLYRLCNNYGCVPSHVELGQQYVDDMTAKFPGVNFQTVIDALAYPDIPQGESWIPEYSRIHDEYNKLRDTIAQDPGVSVQALADEVNATVQALLDDWWERRGG